MGTFFTLGLVVSIAAAMSWRDMKRSPYFFQRLQAGKRLQTYLSASFALFVITMGVGLYSWQAPVDTTVRMAILTNSKPVEVAAEPVELPAMLEPVEEVTTTEYQLESTEESVTNAAPQLLFVADQPLIAEAVALPEEYDRFDPQVELGNDSNFSTLDFSTEVSDEYDAVEPRQLFAEGFYTLFATFDYEGLEDGMVWSWVWRRDGEVVAGGNEVWAYGETGPGYIYYEPEVGFQAGQYSLDVWVNGELMTEAAVVMNDATISANN
jgi:hypothetical protein